MSERRPPPSPPPPVRASARSADGRAVPRPEPSRPAVTRGVRSGGRSARVVAAVLEATLEELAARGYAALSVEHVAARAGVAKTTIYRRWPQKIDLVRAALLESVDDDLTEGPDTGTLEGDLLGYVRAIAARVRSPRGASIWRMLWVEADDPDVVTIKLALRALRRAVPERIVARAVVRGEVPPDISTDLLFQIPVAAVTHRLLFAGGEADEAYLRSVVAVVLHGVLAHTRGV